MSDEETAPENDPLRHARRVAATESPAIALEAADRAVKDLEAREAWEGIAYAHQLRTRALRSLGRHEEALAAFDAAAQAAQRAGQEILAAQLHIGAIDSLGMLGRYDEAEHLATELSASLTAFGDSVSAAKVRGNLGSLYLRRDRYDAALNSYADAETLLDATDELLLRAGLAVNQAIALTYLGRADEAQERYVRAQDIYQSRNLAFPAAVAGANIGFLHHTAGRYAAALSDYTAAYRVFAAEKRDHEAARCDIDTGDTYRALNLLPEAQECYTRAAAVFDRLPLDYDRARMNLGRAAVAFRSGQRDAGFAALDQAQSVFVAQKNRVGEAHVQLLRAEALLQDGQAEPARDEAQTAGAVFAERGLSGWAAEARLITARSGRDTSPETLEEIVQAARTAMHGWLECQAEVELGRYYACLGERDTARRHWRNAINALEAVRTRVAPEDLHTAFLADKEAVYAELAAYLLEGAPDAAAVTEALEVLERSRSRLLLERLLSSLDASPETETTELRVRLSDLRARLMRAYREALTPGDNPDEPRRFGRAVSEGDLSLLEEAYARTLREVDLQGVFPTVALRQTPADVPALQAALQEDETLVIYGLLGDTIAAFVIGSGCLDVIPGVARIAEVRHVARRFRYHLQKRETAPDLNAASEVDFCAEMDGVLTRLYRLLIEPLEACLSGKRLVIAPAGLLHGLPFHAFRNTKGYLLDHFEVVYTPSASVWQTLATQSLSNATNPASPLLVAVPAPGAEKVVAEVEGIARTLPGARTLIGDAATVAAVLKAGEEAPLLHFATHALFRRDNPLFSGLQLGDDWLLAHDLYKVRLRADLVTLSACDTAAVRVEPGEEWMGLARGFLAAGARRVAASLWPAADAATAELMAHFYMHLSQGIAPATALQRAQWELRTTRPHPYYWAAFCLIGAR